MSAALSEAASSTGVDVMDIDSQPSTKAPVKGKGKGKATLSPTTYEEYGDSDVDMRDVDDGNGGVAGRPAKGGGAAGDVGKDKELDMVGVLDFIPREPVYIVWPLASPGKRLSDDGANSGSSDRSGEEGSAYLFRVA